MPLVTPPAEVPGAPLPVCRLQVPPASLRARDAACVVLMLSLGARGGRSRIEGRSNAVVSHYISCPSHTCLG